MRLIAVLRTGASSLSCLAKHSRGFLLAENNMGLCALDRPFLEDILTRVTFRILFSLLCCLFLPFVQYVSFYPL